MKKKGLGKGLDALFDENTIELELAAQEKATLRLSQIEPDKNQPRKVFEKEALEQLAASIREHGLIQPIIVAAAIALLQGSGAGEPAAWQNWRKFRC